MIMPKTLVDFRLPLEATIDLTYRCNNNCLHCWLRMHSTGHEQSRELSFEEIKGIVDEARALGTHRWSISGGEPMLRPDFPEIFNYITAKALSYTLNTNGTLITPKLARLLKRKGSKMVALYGASTATYDKVTRNSGGFEHVMQGFRYLKEAGAGFIVQLIPMKANWHEWDQMIELAQSLSDHWRVGAPWLYLSSCRDAALNAEISRQRLDPRDVVNLDKPDISYEETIFHQCGHTEGDSRLFASCIAVRRDFHIDPYGGMTFCSLIKDPSMRYDLRKGTLRDGWEKFIPSIADREFGREEHQENCGSCELSKDCRWCAVYGWLEHGRFSAPVEYLCEVARENKRFKDEWQVNHRRYFKIADITIRVESDLPIDDATFNSKFSSFHVDAPGQDTVTIRHHFGIPDLKGQNLGKEVYRKAPWAIYRKNGSSIYLGISSQTDDPSLHRVATFTADHTSVRIYHDDLHEESWRKGDLHSLTLFSSDQILIVRLLADRQGCCLQSTGAMINGAGVLFVGHSDIDKSTITNLLIEAGAKGDREVEILCDACNMVRRHGESWQLYGTWNHGDVPQVSSADAPLRAICFIEQATENSITDLTDRNEVMRRLLACLIHPFFAEDWWEKTLDLIEPMARQVPCYVMHFDKGGEIIGEIEKIVTAETEASL